MAHIHVTDESEANADLVEAARDAQDVAAEIDAAGGEATILEPAPGAVTLAAAGQPRLARAWVSTWPYVRIGLYGAAFVGGGMLLAKLFGPRTAHDLGERGGEGFTEGVVAAQRRLAALAPRVAGSPPVPFLAARGQRWR